MKAKPQTLSTDPICLHQGFCINLARMNYRAESPELELKLWLSPPRNHRQVSPPSSAEISPRRSCVSREASPDQTGLMMLVGCPRCLMYVMLLEVDPKCPKCKSTVLLDFLHEDKSARLKKVAN